jgi:spheroidene monooxygenase
MAATPTNAVRDDAIAIFALFDIAPEHRAWGWWQFVIGRRRLRSVPGLRFGKLLGSGHEGRFGLKPSASIQGVFCVFDDEAHADAFAGPQGLLQAWRTRAREQFCLRLRACSSRGSWSGVPLPVTAATPAEGPIASLTRASIRPRRAAAFWRMEPAAERSLAETSGCLLAVGVGEAPLLRQATFTLWESVDAMNAYARHGAHLAAIRAAAERGFFSESMFVRFAPQRLEGSWRGRTLG